MSRVALRDVVDVAGGGTPRKSCPEFYGGGIPWVTPKDMKRPLIGESEVTLTDEGVRNSPAKLVREGSVLVVVRSGVLKHTLPVAMTTSPVTLNQDMKALTPRADLDASYLARLLKALQPTVLSWVRATTADNFPINSLLDLKVDLPPLPEQRRIAAILDHADALRAKRRQLLAHLDALAQAIFHDMFGGRTWPTEKLGDRLQFLTSGSRGWAKYYAPDGDKFIRIQNVKGGYLNQRDMAFVAAPETAEARRTTVQEGDVLLSITADLGRTAVVPDGLGRAFINQHLAILRAPSVTPRYLADFLESPTGQREVLGKDRGATKAGLNFDDVRSVALPIPPMKMQSDYAERVERINAQRANVLITIEADDELFASLQSRAFRGEL